MAAWTAHAALCRGCGLCRGASRQRHRRERACTRQCPNEAPSCCASPDQSPFFSDLPDGPGQDSAVHFGAGLPAPVWRRQRALPGWVARTARSARAAQHAAAALHTSPTSALPALGSAPRSSTAGRPHVTDSCPACNPAAAPAVIAPLTTLGHWQREIETWTDMNCVVYAGGQEDRRVIEVGACSGCSSHGLDFACWPARSAPWEADPWPTSNQLAEVRSVRRRSSCSCTHSPAPCPCPPLPLPTNQPQQNYNLYHCPVLCSAQNHHTSPTCPLQPNHDRSTTCTTAARGGAAGPSSRTWCCPLMRRC